MSKEKLNETKENGKTTLTDKQLEQVSGGRFEDTDGKAGATKAIPEISPDRL